LLIILLNNIFKMAKQDQAKQPQPTQVLLEMGKEQDEIVAKAIADASPEDRLGLALNLINSGLGMSVAKVIDQFNLQDRSEVSDKLIEMFGDIDLTGKEENVNDGITKIRTNIVFPKDQVPKDQQKK
jgi:hypothetical protein